MRRKIFIKYTKILSIILFAFFFSLSYLKAADKIESYAPNCKSNDALYNITYRLNNKNEDRRIGCIGLITINTNKQGYCIEPGVKVGKGYTATGKEFTKYSEAFFNNSKTSAEKRRMVLQILNFSINLNSKGVKNATKEEIYKAYAAQALIWEVVSGERVNFKVDDPSTSNKDFYSIITSNTYSSNSAITSIRNEYKAILSKIRSTYLSNSGPGSGDNVFNTISEKIKTVPLTCSKTKCSLTINDSNFVYWNIGNKDGLDVTKTNNSITISTTSSISKEHPKTIEISLVGNKGTAYAYTNSSMQDVVTLSGLSQSAYLKVYTPKYQLKIVKKSKSDISSLNDIGLKGAKFGIYSDSSCSKIIAEITTNDQGIATYNKLDKPGTYYIKELSAPEGYEISSKINTVIVNSSDRSDSKNYGTKEIFNTNKVFNLTKKTEDETGKIIDLNDGCNTGVYTGPEFEIQENGKSLYFTEISAGIYNYAEKNTAGATTKLKTCNGKFKVYTLPKCNYIIAETKAPDGLTLPSEPTKAINVCESGKNTSFTNGFAGLEFQKKNEDGEFISGGKFSLQMKINNVYKDILLKQIEEGNFVYDPNLSEDDKEATYILLTKNGVAMISKLPPGEYRIVEKEAPKGYELIEDKDSTAKVTIKDDKKGYYLVELVNQKTNMHGSEDSAELIVTITTGRKVPNYAIITSILVVLLVITIILRKKNKK